MADNVALPAAAGKAATRDITYSGEAAQAQAVGLLMFSGADDAKTAADVTKAAPLPVDTDSTRSISFKGAAGSFRTLGAAALLQNVFSIENAAGSTVLVRVTGLDVKLDATAVLTAVLPFIRLSRPTALPTGGTALAKASRDTALASNASVIVRAASASDGGAATVITATQGDMFKAAGGHRMHTAVGQVIVDASSLLPFGEPITLRAGESLLVTVNAAATTSNPATNHWQVGVAWEEYTAAT